MEIYSKMLGVLKDIDYIKKDQRNSQQGYNFRGIDDMYNSLHDLFAKHDIFITSKVITVEREERITAKGGTLIYTVCQNEFTFHTLDGSSVSSIMIGEAMDSGDKSANKAMSTALKYALMQSFLIPTKELKDSDPDSYEVTPKKIAPKFDKKTKTIPEIKDFQKFCDGWDGELNGNQINWKGEVWTLSENAKQQLETFMQDEYERIEIIKRQVADERGLNELFPTKS